MNIEINVLEHGDVRILLRKLLQKIGAGDCMEDVKNAIHCLKQTAGSTVCEDCNLYPCHHSVVEDMARVAIEALEKQMPKKVVSYSDDESDYVYCPCCNVIVGSNEFVWEDFYYREWRPMHCQECGQAMVWK